MDEITSAAKTQQEAEEPSTWYKIITLEDAKAFIKASITSAARSFIAIGYYLKRIRDGELYLDEGHESIWEFAQAEYGISKSTASRYMTMNDRFSAEGNSPIIDEKYKDFEKSKLQEMLSMTEEQIEQVTPAMKVQEIRGMRVTKETPYFELEGQMNIETDFPELLPDEPEPVQQTVTSQVFTMSVADLIGGDVGAEYESEPEAIAISQQKEPVPTGNNEEPVIPELEPDKPVIVDTEFTEVLEPKEEYSLDYFLKEQKQKLNEFLKVKGIPCIILERQKYIVGALSAMKADLEIEELKQTYEQEQPELPILKNNDQRAAFVDMYETWPLWIETEQTGERYYRYDLSDGTSMVVKVHHAMLFDYEATGDKWEDRFREGYGKHEYYLLQEGKFFRDCEANKSALVEKLKEAQKKG